jgi:pimeloyl-ACP methyl ester carboxylesterase
LLFLDKIFTQTQTSLIHLIILLLVVGTTTYFGANPVVAQGTVNDSQVQLRILDPNPNLINLESGALINDVSAIHSINDTRIGTIADGVSKLLLVASYENPLNFTILDNDNNSQSKGTLSSLSSNPASIELQNSTVIVDPQITDSEIPVVTAVYTPPLTYPNDTFETTAENHETIKLLVEDVVNPSNKTEISLSLYPVPVVLVHGIWSNPDESWIQTNFTETLETANIEVYLADYRGHNAETFDPYSITSIGNYGIDSIRNSVSEILDSYRNDGIAASQVDIVGHSMGGLMARGFVQQPDFVNENNYFQGYIHRLITIGTPHYGAHLADILFDYRNNWYCIQSNVIINPSLCLPQYLKQLKTIFEQDYQSPIDKGGVEALAPGSIAYSHLCETNVPSYAIAGSWAPKATNSHSSMEIFYKTIIGNLFFDLDKDGFQGYFEGNNDLQVSIDSQVGGLASQFRTINSTIPNQSEVYSNTVHSSSFIALEDQNVTSELKSKDIQNDVVTLLHSPQDKFASAIGLGSPCQIPQ